MAELATLARPYAKAIFELAVEKNELENWSDNLVFLTAVTKDTTMAQVISNPDIEEKTLINLLIDICSERFDEIGKNLIKVLAENNRLPVVSELSIQFEQMKAVHQGYAQVEIISPYPVEPSQLQEVEDILKKRLGEAVDISTTIDKTLLGGWLVRVDKEVIDLSVNGYLRQLAADLRRF
ncbi:F0F1 ATP synthase subunit delta [Candidatus Halobeggiatoa sp. HSG11]|nr:F0F1 ATP synthase subunit delta [Candidatus Halobeggiatoa sp. HSG11]